MNRLKTLRVRFALWTAGVLFAALVLFGLFVYANMSRSLGRAVDETLRLATIQLLAEVEITNGELTFIEHSIEAPEYTRLRERGFSMRVWNLRGQLLQEYGPYSRDLPEPRLDAFTVLDHAGELTTVPDADTQELVRVYTTPVVDDGRLVGVLQVAENLGDVDRTLNSLLMTLLIGGPIMVIVAGGSGYLLAARAIAPIDRITRTAQHISATDLAARLNLPQTDDEVGRLVATFDSMLARLDRAFRRERQFAADASHELRTPLSAMQTIVDSTLARQRAPAEYERALIDLSQEVERMRTLTEELLHLAESDVARQRERFERVNVSVLLKDVVDSLRTAAEEKGLTLVDNVPDENLTLLGDSDGLIRLFVNLVGNAIKYTEQGIIVVSARSRADNRLVFTISDTGVGIPAEHLPHIFDRFYRVDESRSKNGTGLGLAIALSVAHAHGGDITVESEPGRGATFTVELPVE